MQHWALLIKLICAFITLTMGDKPDSMKTNDDTPKGRILVYAPYSSRSILIKFLPLVEAMAERGHETFFLSPFEISNSSRVKAIQVVDSASDSMGKVANAFKGSGKLQSYESLSRMTQAVLDSNSLSIQSPELERELDLGFDIVMVYTSVPREMGYYLAQKSGAELVLLNSAGQGPMAHVNWVLGQPNNPSYQPFQGVDYLHPMSFIQRILTFLLNYAMEAYRRYMINEQELLLKEIFPNEHITPFLEVEKNVSLVLYTGHPLIDGIRSTAPNFQYIGLMHCRPPKPLPDHLEDFISKDAEHGIIYVSFGSFYKEADISWEVNVAMMTVFGRLKQKVLWKWGGNESLEVPSNVMLSAWFPQQDILGHSNVKLFITHGGQSSVQEALYHETPTVVVPLGLDQPLYSIIVKRIGFGVAVRLKDITEETLMGAITEVLGSTAYAKVAKSLSNLLRDEIISPLDRGVWWLEYLLRNRGRQFWRSPDQDLSWCQYLLLDVCLFLAVATLALGVIFYVCLRSIIICLAK